MGIRSSRAFVAPLLIGTALVAQEPPPGIPEQPERYRAGGEIPCRSD